MREEEEEDTGVKEKDEKTDRKECNPNDTLETIGLKIKWGRIISVYNQWPFFVISVLDVLILPRAANTLARLPKETE